MWPRAKDSTFEARVNAGSSATGSTSEGGQLVFSRVSVQARVIVIPRVKVGMNQALLSRLMATVTVTVDVVLVIVEGLIVIVEPLTMPALKMVCAADVALAAVAPGIIARRQPW